MKRCVALAAVLGMLGAMAGYVALTTTAASATTSTTVIVGAGDFAGAHATDAQHEWAPEDTDADTGTHGIVSGPAASGSGSLAMSVTNTQHEWIVTEGYGFCNTGFANPCPGGPGTLLSSIDALSYSTYRTAGGQMPTLNIEVSPPGDGTGYTTFVYVPDSGSYLDNTWQSWDAFGDTTARWYSTHNVPGGGVFNCAPQTPACTHTWQDIVSSYPNARILIGIGPNVGTGGNFTGNVDDLVIGVGGNDVTYDFEPQCSSVCYVDGTNGRDNATGEQGDPFKTIAEGMAAVNTGGTVNLAAGTYVTNVTITKSLTLAGAGQGSTILEPSLSAPNPGGCGGSLCAGASNVVLVQANNVTIHDLTVEGNNPSVSSGVTAGGVDIDARNGIITDHTMGVFNGLSVHDTTVKDIYLRGIYASSGGTFNFTNNTVNNVQADASSIGMFNFGGSGVMTGNHVSATNDALSANHSTGTTFTNNVVTNSASGVHTDNSGDSGGTADVISGNNVSACTAGGYGVWAFVPYVNFTISNNTVSGCSVGLALFGSCNFSAGNGCPGGVVPTTTFSGNTVNGAAGDTGVYVTTDTLGFGDAAAKINANQNVINGNDDGVDVVETGTSHVTAAINRNDLGGNTNSGITNAGSTVVDGTCNWWGAGDGPSGAGPGDGSAVSSNVTFVEWLPTSNLSGPCGRSVSLGSDRFYVEGNSGTQTDFVPVTLSSPQATNTTVKYATANGSASAASDYVKATGTLTIPAGQTHGLIAVTINGDTTPEPNQYFTVNLSNPSAGVLLGRASAKQWIFNDDIKATMKNAAVAEGGSIPFSYTLKYPMAHAVTVQFCTNTGTASASDYTFTACPGSQSMTIQPGDLTATVSVPTTIDHTTETAETFQMQASVATPDVAPTLTATGTIRGNHT